jgi:hypothetical protein
VSWSSYGAAHRYDVHGDAVAEERCRRAVQDPRARRAEHELREQAGRGDRCALVTLLEILVDENRTEDLRALADNGDGRARATLMETLDRQDRGDELRADVDIGRAVRREAAAGSRVAARRLRGLSGDRSNQD